MYAPGASDADFRKLIYRRFNRFLFYGGGGIDNIDKASSAFGLHISDEFILIAREAN